jgi:hypothetical protein
MAWDIWNFSYDFWNKKINLFILIFNINKGGKEK